MLLGQPLAVVVPAYNTGPRVLRVLATLPPFVDLVVVVDDASTDDTARLLATVTDPRVRCLRHTHNRGVGGALATGYGAALDLGADLVAVLAGDGQMDPEDLLALAAPVAEGRADYARGDRLSHPSCARVMPWTRFLGNHILSFLTRLATGLPGLSDSQCGYTVIARRALLSLDLGALWRRYGYPNHLLGALVLAGWRVTGVTVAPRYGDERSGVRLRDALWTVPRIILWVAWARASCWLLRERRALGAGARGVLELSRSPR
ncbi:MAG: glycosyltransferase family 2 protein [Deltaproteobacteria bacterium]|nr:glycosyltransferase family 2 protein [Deltaproteobacteria bacterium]